MDLVSSSDEATNSLKVNLSGIGLTASGLVQELERFGELSHLDILPGLDLSVSVSFFDLRASMRAKAYLGDSCTYEPEHGERAVRLQGKEGFDPSLVPEVSAVKRVEGTDSDFIVEFFDTRVAAKVAAHMGVQVTQTDQDIECAKATTPSGCSRPRKVPNLLLSELRWQDLANNVEWRTALHLRGLPRSLCGEGAFEAFLHANNLLNLVERTRVLPTRGKQLGCAVIVARSVAEVPKLAKFFHGRQFGASPPVAVSFAPVRGAGAAATGVRLAKNTMAAAEPWRVGDFAADDNKVQPDKLVTETVQKPCALKVRDGDSDISTTMSSPRTVSGDDVAPEERRQSIARKLPPGLAPPPGLEAFGY